MTVTVHSGAGAAMVTVHCGAGAVTVTVHFGAGAVTGHPGTGAVTVTVHSGAGVVTVTVQRWGLILDGETPVARTPRDVRANSPLYGRYFIGCAEFNKF